MSESDPAPHTLTTSAATTQIVCECWMSALGHRGRSDQHHLLHASLGMKRILRLQQLLRERTGASIPLSTLLGLGTVPSIAAAIEAGSWPSHCPRVLLREGKPERQLYIVPAAGGVILELCELGMAIPFEGQVGGLQAPGIDGETEPPRSVEALAAHYVQTILEWAVGAEVDLLGYSFSGLVVFEMARLLREKGVQPRLVAVLDSTCHPRYWRRVEAWRFAVKRAKLRWARLRGMAPAEATAFMGDSVRALTGLLRRLRVKGDATASAPVQTSAYYVAGLPSDLQKLRDACIVAFEGYRPMPVDFPVVLFKSRLGNPHACDPHGVWKHLVPQLTVKLVPGTHTTMVRRPHVQELAVQLGTHLC